MSTLTDVQNAYIRQYNLQPIQREHLLHHAVAYGHTDALKQMLDSGADPNIFNAMGNTPLHIAADMNSTKALKALLKSRTVNALIFDRNGSTPMHIAAKKGYTKALIVLLKRNIDPAIPDLHGDSPLAIAIKSRQIKTATILIDYQRAREALDSEGQTPLHLAIIKRNRPLIKLLLSKNVDIEKQDSMGNSPLYDAVILEDFETSSLLIRSGANINAVHPNGYTALHIAIITPNPEMARLLLSLGANPNIHAENTVFPLYLALTNSTPQIALLLLSCGADINACYFDGYSPLHFVLTKLANPEDRKKRIVFLLERGADPLFQDRFRNTPLHYAAAGIEAAEIAAVDEESRSESFHRLINTPLPAIVPLPPARTHLIILEKIINSIIATTLRGKQPSRLLAQREIGKTRVFHGVNTNLNSQNIEGNTPLHIAILRKRLSLARMIFATGLAQDWIKNNEGKSPKDLWQEHFPQYSILIH